MNVAVTGSSGLIGSALVRDLRDRGDTALRLVRRDPRGPDEVRWTPGGDVDVAALDGVDAVVHLAGAGLGDRRWTPAYKRELLDSRTIGTRTLATALAGLRNKPRVLISSSGINWYGTTGDREADESAPPGSGFLSDLTHRWEDAAEPARQAGIRVVHIRTGLVLARQAPLVSKTLPLFKLGLGGRLASGRQWMSWISLPDTIAALRFLLEHEEISGPVNLTAPEPVTNRTYTAALGRVLRRPTPFPVPGFALDLVMGGGFASETLASLRVVPAVLVKAGFSFQHRDIDTALGAVLRHP